MCLLHCIYFLFDGVTYLEGVIEGHVSLINDYDVADESDDDYGQFVGHHSDEFLAREELDVNSNSNSNVIEGCHHEDGNSQAQILNTVMAAVSIIILSFIINQSEEIQNFLKMKGWRLSYS